MPGHQELPVLREAVLWYLPEFPQSRAAEQVSLDPESHPAAGAGVSG
jgi:hypothetical protein